MIVEMNIDDSSSAYRELKLTSACAYVSRWLYVPARKRACMSLEVHVCAVGSWSTVHIYDLYIPTVPPRGFRHFPVAIVIVISNFSILF